MWFTPRFQIAANSLSMTALAAQMSNATCIGFLVIV
jgi:hypothetical protein